LSGWTEHLVIAPIVIPLLAGAAMMLAGERRRAFNSALGVASALALLPTALVLRRLADGGAAPVRSPPVEKMNRLTA
jgi:multicomponent K+:H+ antiporter subunit D